MTFPTDNQINDVVTDVMAHVEPLDINGAEELEILEHMIAGAVVSAKLSSRSTYYIDKNLFQALRKTLSLSPDSIVRVARRLQYYSPGRQHPISNYIFQRDKDCNGGLYYNCNQFSMGLNTSTNGCVTPRWNGNAATGNAYKLKRDNQNKEQNLEALRVINHGPAGAHVPLRCAYSGVDVENYAEPDYPSMVKRFFDLHHYLFKDRVSVHKSGRDPADILKSSKLNSSNLVEFFGCLPLHKGKHAWIHDNFKEQDLTFWLDHWGRGLGYKPYVLRGPNEFREVCLALNVADVKWQEFIRASFLVNVDLPKAA